jgi:hypothetical protein
MPEIIGSDGIEEPGDVHHVEGNVGDDPAMTTR